MRNAKGLGDCEHSYLLHELIETDDAMVKSLSVFEALATFHGVSGKYLQEYIHEFVYRFNRRWWDN